MVQKWWLRKSWNPFSLGLGFVRGWRTLSTGFFYGVKRGLYGGLYGAYGGLYGAYGRLYGAYGGLRETLRGPTGAYGANLYNPPTGA